MLTEMLAKHIQAPIEKKEKAAIIAQMLHQDVDRSLGFNLTGLSGFATPSGCSA